MGRIIEVYPSPDEVVRSVKLKTKKGEFIRLCALLYLWRVLHDDTNVTHDWEELTILSFRMRENLLRHKHNNPQNFMFAQTQQ